MLVLIMNIRHEQLHLVIFFPTCTLINPCLDIFLNALDVPACMFYTSMYSCSRQRYNAQHNYVFDTFLLMNAYDTHISSV